jgi:hypothetical protein
MMPATKAMSQTMTVRPGCRPVRRKIARQSKADRKPPSRNWLQIAGVRKPRNSVWR